MANLLHLLAVIVVAVTEISSTDLSYQIYEEMASKTVIGNVVRDSNLWITVSNLTNLRFSLLTQGNPHSLLFNVDEATGDLSISRLLDRETICSFLDKCDLNFEIIVQSQLGSFFRKISVTVTLLDINDNSPEFPQSEFSLDVSEGVTVGTTFPITNAVDKDTAVNNSVHNYELLDNTDMFSLDTHKVLGGNLEASLKLLKTLDREDKNTYKLNVIAKDNGTPPKTGSLVVTINVEDINDNPPVFEYPSYSVNISETLPIRGLIVRLKASDKDLGENANITYHFTARQPETLLKPFTLYKHSGELRLASSLESSAGKSFELLTEARDNGNPSLTEQVRVHIHVLDTHNNPPEIHVNTFSTSGSAEVSESSTVGRAVAHIGVHDPDSGANGVVNCSIAHDYITISQLDVNEYKGILSKPLDREKISQHSVIVVCYDSGSPRLTTSVSFQVKVLDENDNPPVFLQSVYYASFTENNFIPQYVTTVSAVDYDAGSNAEIAYKVIGDNKDDFKILSNGTLSAIRQFDREASPLVIVKIEASDSGQKRLTSTVNVEITLEDLNDKRPEFKHSVFYFNVSENMLTRNDVGQIEAFDRDENENAALVFSMGNPANGATPFTITPSGMVQTTKTLDRESTNRYVISVVATDMGEPPLSSSVQVVVTVNDMNDQSPVILYPNDENNTVSIPNSYAPKTGFSAILAYDLDEGENGRIEYFMKKGNFSDNFEVHVTTGEIFTTKKFEEHELGIYHLVIAARDMGSPTRYAFSDLFVEVYHGNSTFNNASAVLSTRNIITVAVLLCITIILGLIVLVIIYYIRQRDKQKRIYNAKSEENRVISIMKQNESDDNNSDLGITNSSSNIQLSPTESVASSTKKEVSFCLDDENNIMCFESDSEYNPATKPEKSKLDSVSKEFQEAGRIDSSSVISDEVSTSDSGRGGSDVDVSSQTISHDTDLFYTQTGLPSSGSSSNRSHPPANIPQYSAHHQNISPLVPNKNGLYRQSSVKPPPAYNSEHRRQWKNKSAYNKSYNPVHHPVVPNRRPTQLKDNDNTCIYMEMKAPLRCVTNSPRCPVQDESGNDALWENDTTTTSGSYTIDADELCHEIDKLFFKESDNDIIV